MFDTSRLEVSSIDAVVFSFLPKEALIARLAFIIRKAGFQIIRPDRKSKSLLKRMIAGVSKRGNRQDLYSRVLEEAKRQRDLRYEKCRNDVALHEYLFDGKPLSEHTGDSDRFRRKISNYATSVLESWGFSGADTVRDKIAAKIGCELKYYNCNRLLYWNGSPVAVFGLGPSYSGSDDYKCYLGFLRKVDSKFFVCVKPTVIRYDLEHPSGANFLASEFPEVPPMYGINEWVWRAFAVKRSTILQILEEGSWDELAGGTASVCFSAELIADIKDAIKYVLDNNIFPSCETQKVLDAMEKGHLEIKWLIDKYVTINYSHEDLVETIEQGKIGKFAKEVLAREKFRLIRDRLYKLDGVKPV